MIDHTVRAGTMMESADVVTRPMQYLYQEGDSYVFMDSDTYEQHSIAKDVLGFASKFLAESAEAQVTMYEGSAIGVQLPQKMVFEVVETIDDPARGNTRHQRPPKTRRSTPDWSSRCPTSSRPATGSGS